MQIIYTQIWLHVQDRRLWRSRKNRLETRNYFFKVWLWTTDLAARSISFLLRHDEICIVTLPYRPQATCRLLNIIEDRVPVLSRAGAQSFVQSPPESSKSRRSRNFFELLNEFSDPYRRRLIHLYLYDLLLSHVYEKIKILDRENRALIYAPEISKTRKLDHYTLFDYTWNE